MRLFVLVLTVTIALVISLPPTHTISPPPSAPTPASLASVVINPVFASPHSFLNWDYGGAIIVDSFYDFALEFKEELTKIIPTLESFIETQETDPSFDGYKLLHNISIPFGGAVGDSVGLFPIALLARVNYHNKNPDSSYDNSSDLSIARKVAAQYILQWPHFLPDGTFSRATGWSGQPAGHSFVWDDDDYMGLGVLNRLAVIDARTDYANVAGKMQLTYAQHLRDPSDGLFYHGFNLDNAAHSCCKWGRGNGWLMMAHIETLIALDANKDPLFASVLEVLRQHADSLRSVQSADGRWHQVLNNASTYLETSASAMYLWSFMEGVMRGWLPAADYGPSIETGWTGLVKTVDTVTGRVSGVCEGTGIGPSAEWYNERSTNYLSSSPGLGSVFRAIVGYARYKGMGF